MKFLRFTFALVATCSFVRAESVPATTSTGFVRAIERADKTTACETLSAKYLPSNGRGPAVWLIGVAHIGTPEYYAAIQQQLDRHSVVLYEGIGLDESKKAGPGAATNPAGLQSGLAKALGLVFQLDAIDYRRPHFLNSDIKADKIAGQVEERAKKEPAAKDGNLMVPLMDMLQGSGAIGEMMNQVVSVLGQTPAMREMTKAILVEALGRAHELIGLARNISPEMKNLFDVILTERNAVVIADLRTQIAKRGPTESIAIFYGAAHMDEIARRLRDELRYIPAQEEWLAAFTSDPAKSGMDPVQLRFMIEMAKMQLKALQGPGKK
jgi:hypothetical protein